MSSLLHPPVDPAARPVVRRAAVILAGAILAALFCQASSLLNDPDTQWHIAVGRLMWATATIPQSDVFSHTYFGAPWMAKEWLSQALLFAAFAIAGWWGVAALAAAAVAASFGLLFGWLLGRLRWTAALAAVLVALLLALPEVVARPHILVLPVVVLWTIELAGARERGSAPRLWTPALMVLWANMHASYPIGLILAGAFALEAVAASPASARRSVVLWWGAFLACSVVAACVTPYGYRTIAVVFSLMQSQEATGYVSEWQPMGLDGTGLVTILALVGSLGFLLRRPRENLFRAGAVLLLGYLAVRHARFTLLFGMLAPVLMAGPIARGLRACAAGDPRLGHPGVLMAVVASLALVAGTTMKPERNVLVTPEPALAFAQAHGLTGPVYNDYDYGGFLILNGVKTFIDGRNDQLFTDGFITRLSAALAADDDGGFAAILDRHKVTWALIKAESPAAQHFSHMAGWSKRFSDRDAAVYARDCVAMNCPTS